MQIFLLVALLLCSQLVTAKPFVIKDSQPDFTLENHCVYFVDQSNIFTPNIDDTARWLDIQPGSLRLGFIDAPLWIRCDVINRTLQQNWILQIKNPQISQMQLYQRESENTLISQITGMNIPYTKRPIQEALPTLKITLPYATNSKIWLKLDTFTPVSINVKLFTPDKFHKQKQLSLVVDSLFYGIVLAMMCYNLFLGFSVNDKSYLTYSGYLFFIALYVLMLIGYSQALLFPFDPQIELYFVVIVVNCALLLAMRFALCFLRLGPLRPRLSKVMKFNNAFMLFLVILGVFFSFKWYAILVSVFSVYVLGFNIYLGYYSFRHQNYSPARIYTMSWTVLTIGLLIHNLTFNTLIESNFLTQHTLQLSIALEAILLSIALGERFNLIKNELAEKDAQVQTQLSEANKQLQKALTLSQQALDAKRQIIALVSHEFRTPINIALGSLSQIEESLNSKAKYLANPPLQKESSPNEYQEDQKNELKKELVRNTLQIRHAMSRISHQIENLITAGELLTQALAPQRKLCNLSELVQQWRSHLLSKDMPIKQFDCKVDNHSNSPCVVDPRLFNQIVINILDFISSNQNQKTLCLNIKVAQNHIQLLFNHLQKNFAKDIADKLKSFTRQNVPSDSGSDSDSDSDSDNELTLDLEMDLQLSLLGKLVSLLEGNITVIAQQPDEAVLQISLSNYASQLDYQAQLPQVPRHSRILIVEDNQLNAMILKRIVEKQGFKSDVAMNGKQGIDILQTQDYDLIFMDLNMPVLDGVSATQSIRKMSAINQTIPIVAVTANTTDDVQKSCKIAGFNNLIAKPFNEKQIVDELYTWLLKPEEMQSDNGNQSEQPC